MRTIKAIGATFVLALSAVGAMAAEPVKIGIAIPLSGPAASYGQDMKRGSDLAAAQVNAGGGILGGRKIELVYEDDKGSPPGGVAAVQKLMAMHRVQAITGGANSSVVLAESAATKGRVLQVNAGAQADAITDQGSPYLFQINNTVSANSKAFNKFIIETLKPKSAAYMGENTEFNKTTLEILRNDLKAANIELVDVSTYDADTNDFTSILTKIKAAKPDLLYVADAYPARAAQLWKQVRQLGGFPKEVMSPGVVALGMIRPSEGAMNGVYTGDIYATGVADGPSKSFVDAFRTSYKADPGKAELVMYEAVSVIASAMDKANTDTDYAKISETLRKGNWPSPRGGLEFDAKGRATAPVFYVQRVTDGDLKTVDIVKVR